MTWADNGTKHIATLIILPCQRYLAPSSVPEGPAAEHAGVLTSGVFSGDGGWINADIRQDEAQTPTQDISILHCSTWRWVRCAAWRGEVVASELEHRGPY